MKVNDEELNPAKIIELELTIRNLHYLIFFKDKEIEELINLLKQKQNDNFNNTNDNYHTNLDS